jgi:hypothetical protein
VLKQWAVRTVTGKSGIFTINISDPDRKNEVMTVSQLFFCCQRGIQPRYLSIRVQVHFPGR